MASPPLILVPPAPISPTFNDNVDVLIQDMLKNKSGQVSSYNTLLERASQDEATIFEILDKLKYFNNTITTSSGDVLIDCGTYLIPNENVLIDCGLY